MTSEVSDISTTSNNPTSQTLPTEESPTLVPITSPAVQNVNDLTTIGGELISQGAEARTYKYNLFGLDCIVKERFKKTYRHPTLDQKITNKRLLQEIRSMNKCKKNGVDVPSLLLVDLGNNRIFMEYIKGITVKQFLYDHEKDNYKNEKINEICKSIGYKIAILHQSNLIHGDLTTSNLLLRDTLYLNNNNNNNNEENKHEIPLVVIDFGLSFTSANPEDKAVDLYVLERAFISTHPSSELLFEEIIKGYKEASTQSNPVLNRLDQVRLRGRKKLAFG